MAFTKLSIIMEAAAALIVVEPREAIVVVGDNKEDTVEEVVDSEAVTEVDSEAVAEADIDHADAAIRKSSGPMEVRVE
jgi:hypothetical protein